MGIMLLFFIVAGVVCLLLAAFNTATRSVSLLPLGLFLLAFAWLIENASRLLASLR